MGKRVFEKNKSGQIVLENVIFIVLNLIFLAIMVVFLYTKMSGASLIEEQYAKQIALLIDAGKPGMQIKLDMDDALKEAEKNKIDRKGIVTINENIVRVQIRNKGGYSYSFFNDVSLNNPYFSGSKVVLILNEKNG